MVLALVTGPTGFGIKSRYVRRGGSYSWLLPAFLMVTLAAPFSNVTAQHECCGVTAGGAGIPLPQSPGQGTAGIGDYGEAAQAELAKDTSRIALRTFGYFSYGLSGDGHRADPLGTGGKLPLAYTTALYKENGLEQPTLTDRDLRLQYMDFGYLPLWRNNVLFSRVSFRFNDQLRANVGISYGGELGQPGTVAPGQFGVGEAVVVLTPKNIPGLAITAGNILDAGNYCALYNQNPLENFIYTGLLGSYSHQVNDRIGAQAQIGVGGTMQNVTPLYDRYNTAGVFPDSYIKSTRNRSYLNGRLGVGIMNLLAVKISGGYQYVPQDSIEKFASATGDTIGKLYESTEGWFGGLEVSFVKSIFSQNLSLNYSKGDVLTGSGSPDYVRYARIDSLDSGFGYKTALTTEWLSRENSASLTGAYWSSVNIQRFTIAAGVWGNYRLPAQNTIAEASKNAGYNDSVLAFAGLDTVNSISLSTEPFATVKASIFPSVKIVGPLSFGLRLDRIHYLTPDAHTNAQEPMRDQTLRPIRYPGITGEVFSQSKWEREAVDATIATPQLVFNIDGIAGFSVAYSQAWYDKPVDRQGSISNTHYNVTLSTFLTYQFKQ